MRRRGFLYGIPGVFFRPLYEREGKMRSKVKVMENSEFSQKSPRTKLKLNPLALVLGLSVVFFLFFLAVSGALFLSRSTSGGKSSGSALFKNQAAVGVIELNGVIMDSKKFIKRLKGFEDRDDVKAVVVRLNSPGGAVAPSQEIYEAVRHFPKPLVASMGSVAASGAYYVAMGAKKVFANAGTITGSIGVIMEFANLEKLYEWAKIQRYVIKTGKFKDAGSEFREMTSEERALLQTMVDDVLGQFKKAVSDGRKLPMPKVDDVADGRIFSGAQAKALNLVDELGTLEDAVTEAAKQAKITGKPRVVYYEKSKTDWLDLILSERGADEESESNLNGPTGLAGVLERVVSRSLGLNVQTVGREPGIYWLWKGAR